MVTGTDGLRGRWNRNHWWHRWRVADGWVAVANTDRPEQHTNLSDLRLGCTRTIGVARGGQPALQNFAPA